MKVSGAQQLRHRMAELGDAPVRQPRLKIAPPVSPARLREIAAARRTDADQKESHLARRGGEEDYHARWARIEITRLREEAEDLERQADAAERSMRDGDV